MKERRMWFILTNPRDPAALGGPLAGLSFVTGLATAMATAKSPYPRPGSTPQDVQEYFIGSATSARISVAGQLLSSAALVPFTASVAKLAGRTGRSSGPLRAAAVAGGGFAAATLATSALGSAALTREQPDLATVRTLQNLVFLAG